MSISTNIFLSVILVFAMALIIPMVINNVLLTDDLARVQGGHEFLHITHFPQYLYQYLNTQTMSSRPVSGTVTAVISYFTGFNEYLYYLGYIFFLGSVYVVFKFSNCLSNNYAFDLLATSLYLLLPIGTSLIYSPLMLNSALATIFYCLSVLILLKKKQNWRTLCISGIAFICSVFSYEIFIPLIMLNLVLVKKNRITYLAGIIIPIIAYRKFFEPYFFTNYYHRDNVVSLLNFRRVIMITYELSKVMFFDLLISLYRSISAIRFFKITDFIMLGLLNGTAFFYFKNLYKNTALMNNLKLNIYFIILFGALSAALIFYASDYSPSLFGYDNRTMGALRLFTAMLVAWLLFRYYNRYVVCAVILVLTVSALSIKNAWLYSFKVNNEIFGRISNHIIPLNVDIKTLYVIFDQKNLKSDLTYSEQRNKDRDIYFADSHFILQEPMFYASWEQQYYVRKLGLNKNVKILYYYFPDEVRAKPYYLFDLTSDKITVVK